MLLECKSALTMIAGEIEDVMFIPFNETTEEYRQKLNLQLRCMNMSFVLPIY